MIVLIQHYMHAKISLYRANFDGEIAPFLHKLQGLSLINWSKAAQFQVANGAQIVDISMGCPAKKSAVSSQARHCFRMKIWLGGCDNAVLAVDVPVTLKLVWDLPMGRKYFKNCTNC